MAMTVEDKVAPIGIPENPELESQTLSFVPISGNEEGQELMDSLFHQSNFLMAAGESLGFLKNFNYSIIENLKDGINTSSGKTNELIDETILINGEVAAVVQDISQINAELTDINADVAARATITYVDFAIASESNARATSISSLDTKYENITNDITFNVTTNTTEIDNTNTALGGVNMDLQQAKTDLNAADSLIQTSLNNVDLDLQGSKTLLQNNIDGVQQNVNTVDGKVDGVSADLTAAQTALNNSINAVDGDLQDYKITVNTELDSKASINYVDTSISNEAGARSTAITNLDTEFTSKTDLIIQDVNANNVAIGNNNTAIGNVDADLQGFKVAINTEVNSKATITYVDDSISTESLARSTAISELDTEFNNKTNTIANNLASTDAALDLVDTDLQQAKLDLNAADNLIQNYASDIDFDLQQSKTNLSNDINAVNTKADNIAGDLSATELALNTAINNVDEDLQGYKLTVTQDLDSKANITYVDNAISNEAGARTTAITNLDTDFTNKTNIIIQDVDAAELAIGNNSTAIGNVDSDLQGFKTAVYVDINSKAAITYVDDAISTEQSARATAISNLDTSFSAEITRVDGAILAIDTDLQGYKTTVTDTYATITALQSAVSDAEGARASIETNLSTNYSTTTETNTAINGAVSPVETRVTTAESNISTLETSVSNNSGAISSIETNLATNYSTTAATDLAISGAVDPVAQRVTTAETNISTLETATSNNEAAIGSIETNITTNYTTSTDINSAVGAVDTKADNAQTAANTADGKAVSAQSSADTAQSAADSADAKAVAAQNDLNTYKTTVTNTYATITALQTAESNAEGARAELSTNITAEYKSDIQILEQESGIERGSTLTDSAGTTYFSSQVVGEESTIFRGQTDEEIFRQIVPNKYATITYTESVEAKADSALATVGVELDVNGRVIGWKATNDGTVGNFDVVADFFRIFTPESNNPSLLYNSAEKQLELDNILIGGVSRYVGATQLTLYVGGTGQPNFIDYSAAIEFAQSLLTAGATDITIQCAFSSFQYTMLSISTGDYSKITLKGQMSFANGTNAGIRIDRGAVSPTFDCIVTKVDEPNTTIFLENGTMLVGECTVINQNSLSTSKPLAGSNFVIRGAGDAAFSKLTLQNGFTGQFAGGLVFWENANVQLSSLIFDMSCVIYLIQGSIQCLGFDVPEETCQVFLSGNNLQVRGMSVGTASRLFGHGIVQEGNNSNVREHGNISNGIIADNSSVEIKGDFYRDGILQ